MAGHSKWAQIKRKKGIRDVERGAIFTKLSKLITLAVIQSGGITDPQLSVPVRLALEKAREARMPSDTIERALNKASNVRDSLQEAIYEGYGPAGTAYIVQCATDNTNRTVSELRTIFDKNGGKLGASGSVQYLFNVDLTNGYEATAHYEVEVTPGSAYDENVTLMSVLEDHPDVQQVISNIQFSE